MQHVTGHSKSSNSVPLVPEAMGVLDQLKWEVAMEVGIDLPADGYYGNMSTREMGRLGGNMTKRLVQIAEEAMIGRNQF